MTVPNMDTKRIKRLEGGAFSIQTKADAAKTASICDHCGIYATCRILEHQTKMSDLGCSSLVTSCRSFQPALGFSVLGGLDLPVWNTIRLGAAWVKRLDAGMTVTLVDTRSSSIIGEASVLRCERLSLINAVTHHAEANHAIQAKMKAQTLDPADASREMRKILRNAYGTTYTRDERDVSVVYLERR